MPAPTTTRLPTPSADALAHSEQLRTHLHSLIQVDGCISFAEYMQQVLYAPGLGYYVAGSRKFGKAGDFVTAPELSPLFSACIARAVLPILEGLPQKNLLEVGAGSGVMAADILSTLYELEAAPERYFILELSAELRARQGETIKQKVPQLLSRVTWLESLPVHFTGVVLGNEVLDAMPVHVFTIQHSQAQEMYVGESGEGFDFQPGPLSDPRLKERVESIQQTCGRTLTEGYTSEINLLAEDWLRSIAASLEQGAILLIDYGFPQCEFYHPQRSRGTLMCHYRHYAHEDPFYLPGLQDITTHVDFTAMAEAATAAGLEFAGYTNQAAFLLANGLAQIPAAENVADQLDLANQIKRLTMPQEMGELFKVIAFTKGEVAIPAGFALLDQRHRL